MKIMLGADAVSSEKSARLFENFYRFVSLWEIMTTIPAIKMLEIADKLLSLQLGLDCNGESRATRYEIAEVIEQLVEFCRDMRWVDVEEQARRLERNCSEGNQYAEPGVLSALASDLRCAFTSKAQRIKAIVIPEGDIGWFENGAASLCRGPLCSDLAFSEEELNLAGKAYALGLSTASVIHAMRAVESSLHAMCKRLNVVYPGGIGQQDWKVLSEKIVAEIKKLDTSQRSQQKTEAQARLSSLMLAADGFRNAWRNHCAHARSKYEGHEAKRILGYVGDFFHQLSADIEAIP